MIKSMFKTLEEWFNNRFGWFFTNGFKSPDENNEQSAVTSTK